MPYIHCYVVLIIMATKTEIKNEMNDWYGFELTDQQVDEFLNEHPEAIHFDTVERETFADYIAKKITGMLFPMNGDSQEYKQKFYAEMKENSKPMGYIWNLD